MPEAPVTGPWGGMAAVGPTEAAWRDVEEDDRKYVDIYIYIHLEPSMCFPEFFWKADERWGFFVFCKE